MVCLVLSSIAGVGCSDAPRADHVVKTEAALTSSPIGTASGAPVSAVEGAPWSGTVGTFTADPSASASSFVAMISWGDGSPASSATVVAIGGGTFDIVGDHTYAEGGNVVVTVTISSADGTLLVTTASAAAVADAQILTTGRILTTIGPYNGPVASITDLDPNATPSDFTAAIFWGDGSPISFGTIAANASGGFDVIGSHVYTAFGTFSVAVTITTDEGVSWAATSTAVVIDPAPVMSGATFQATEGVPWSGAIGRFTDPDPNATGAEYAVTILWGDGSAPTAGGVSPNAQGGFDVTGRHTYTTVGTYTVTATINDAPAGQSTFFTTTAVVQDAPLVASASAISAIEGAAFSGPVATFTDANPNALPSDYSTSIDWGDGSPLAAGIVGFPAPGKFVVTGAHTYVEAGTFNAVVTILDPAGARAILTNTAVVLDAPLAASGMSFTATEGVAWNGAIATITDANPSGSATELSALVSWGDGSAAAPGIIAANGSGGFTVVGGHVYATAGTFLVQVTVTDDDGGTATATTTAHVADAPITASPVVLCERTHKTFTATVAELTDANPAAVASGFSATIAWGDGTTSTGTVVAKGSGFAITGTHEYRKAGTHPVTVTITDRGGSTATVVSTIVTHHNKC
jgi:hypothetical protein